ncbi:hypothetical protein F4604DRAFT_1934373 [Suillus subluteus]|nr:hypothetical protein F4604DRAFT_1934373 [Suillus subluteus]
MSQKKACNATNNEPAPSGNKSKIWADIAQQVFKDDTEYGSMYAEEKSKFTQVAGNRLSYLRTKYKKHHSRFKQTGAGVSPLDASGAKNLREQVMMDFPWYDALDGLWKDNLAFAPWKGKAPPPVPSPVGGESAAPDVLPDGIPNVVAQGKGKEKAPPIPYFNNVHESMDFLDDADTHNVPPIQSSTLGRRHSNNFVAEHTMDEQEAKEPLDKVFEPDGQEDGYTICQSTKCPYLSPSPPPTYAPNILTFPPHRKFKSHADRAVNRGALHTPKMSSSIASSSSSSVHMHTTSSTPSPSASHTLLICKLGTAHRTSQKSGLSQCVDAKMEDVKGQVQSLTDCYSQHNIKFQCEQAEKEHGDAAIVHQRAQEAKALELQVLKAQARVQAKKKAALQLKIDLLKLKGGVASG